MFSVHIQKICICIFFLSVIWKYINLNKAADFQPKCLLIITISVFLASLMVQNSGCVICEMKGMWFHVRLWLYMAVMCSMWESRDPFPNCNTYDMCPCQSCLILFMLFEWLSGEHVRSQSWCIVIRWLKQKT